MKIVIIDNYDSFTYNLFQYVAEIINSLPQVFYNDKLSFQEFLKLKADAVIISPGPGNPVSKKDFGISKDIIQKTYLPILGVCLGHQGIGASFGAAITKTSEIMHGRTSNIYHNGKDIFANIPQGFTAVRYHSLAVAKLPQELEKTAWTADGVVMGIKHAVRPLWGLQFHPESIGTQYGKNILKNFITLAQKI